MAAEVTGIDVQPMSKAEAAYERLREEIRRGSLEQGERITLKRLSDMLSMSLTPIREALKRLEAEGVVVHQPHRGTFIAEFSAERLDQIYRLRGVLEPMAVRIATERARRDAMVGELERIEELLRVCNEATSPHSVVRTNAELHYALYDLSGDPLLVDFIDKLWAGVPYQSLSLLESSGRLQESRQEHQRIYEALVAGDAEAAEEQMRVHIEHGRAAAIRVH